MSGTVIVGIMISLMFLVSFSEWFYHLAAGLNQLIVDDVYVYYRTATWIAISGLFMVTVFWVLSVVNECPRVNEEKQGIFKYIDCRLYWEAKSLWSQKPTNVLIEEAGARKLLEE